MAELNKVKVSKVLKENEKKVLSSSKSFSNFKKISEQVLEKMSKAWSDIDWDLYYQFEANLGPGEKKAINYFADDLESLKKRLSEVSKVMEHLSDLTKTYK